MLISTKKDVTSNGKIIDKGSKGQVISIEWDDKDQYAFLVDFSPHGLHLVDINNTEEVKPESIKNTQRAKINGN